MENYLPILAGLCPIFLACFIFAVYLYRKEAKAFLDFKNQIYSLPKNLTVHENQVHEISAEVSIPGGLLQDRISPSETEYSLVRKIAQRLLDLDAVKFDIRSNRPSTNSILTAKIKYVSYDTE